MDTIEVNVEKRTLAGKGTIKKLKTEGYVPGVMYSGNESIPIALEEDLMARILNRHGQDVFISARLNGSTIKTRIQEVQRDPVTQDIQHIDLMPVESQTLH